MLAHDSNIFIAATGDVHQHDFGLLHFGGTLNDLGDRVRGFQCGDDSFRASKEGSRFQRFLVGGGNVFGSAQVFEHGVLGADRRIVEAGRDGVRACNLASAVLQYIRVGALQNSGRASTKTGGMITYLITATSRFDDYRLDLFILYAIVEDSVGI